MASVISKLLAARRDNRHIMAAYALWLMVSNKMHGYDVPSVLSDLGRLVVESDDIHVASPRWDLMRSVVRPVEHRGKRRRESDDQVVAQEHPNQRIMTRQV